MHFVTSNLCYWKLENLEFHLRILCYFVEAKPENLFVEANHENLPVELKSSIVAAIISMKKYCYTSQKEQNLASHMKANYKLLIE